MNDTVNLADIRAFVVIAKAGSFTAASELLLCSRSHLSKKLVQLEVALGVKLIIRTTRTQRLTEQGKLFFEQCNFALASIEQAIEQAVDSGGTMQGSIHINCVGGYIGEELIAPLINDFIGLHPEVSIDLDFSSPRVDLISGEFDLVFRMGQLEDSGLIARKLFDIEVVTVASSSYVERYGCLTHPRELKQHQCITGSVNQWSFHQQDAPANHVDVTVAGGFKCKNGRAMISSALAGHGIVRVPALYCQQAIADGLLVPVLKEWQVEPTPFYMVYVQDQFQPLRLRELIKFVQQHIGTIMDQKL